MRNTLLALAFALSASIFAQRTEIDIYGRVTGHFDPHAEKGVTVRVAGGQLAGGSSVVVTDRRGRYLFGLLPGFVYTLEYSRAGAVTKRLRVDTRGVPAGSGDLYQMDVQMTMVDSIPGFDFSVFARPMAEAAYDRSIRNMSWKTAYTGQIEPTLAAVMADYDKVAGGYLNHNGSTWIYVGSEDSVNRDLAERLDTVKYVATPVRIGLAPVDVNVTTYFCVQFITPTPGVGAVSSEQVDGTTRYNYGKFTKESDAKRARDILSSKVPDAVVVAYHNGVMISLEEARHLMPE